MNRAHSAAVAIAIAAGVIVIAVNLIWRVVGW